MSSDSPIEKAVFSERLWAAIKRKGLTYEQTARRAREHLPPGFKLSAVSVWSYAKGRTAPRRLSYVEALGKALGTEPEELLGKTGAAAKEAIPRPATGPPLAHHPPSSRSLPTVQVSDLGNGYAFLHARQSVPWPLALEILQLIMESAPTGAERPQPPAPDQPSLPPRQDE